MTTRVTGPTPQPSEAGRAAGETPVEHAAEVGREAAHLSAILLAGGGGRRLGGADKALLRRGDSSLLGRWAEVLTRRHIPTAVVGPDHLRGHLPQDMLLTREDPPLGGPAAAARAGLLALEETGALDREGAPNGERSVLLAAVDVVDPAPLLDWLGDEARQAGGRAVIPRDGDGRLQYLASAIPARALLARVRTLRTQEASGKPLRLLLEGIEAVHPQLPEGLGADVDTPEDARRLSVDL